MDKEKQLFLAIKAYVPDFIMRQVMAHPDVTLGGWEERREAAVLFSDVSGFTAMSENLAKLGKEGAEELTRILNTYFTTMIDLVHSYGGQIIKFGGDAITCAFVDDVGLTITLSGTRNDPIGYKQQAKLLRACACALEMQAQMGKFVAVETRGGVFKLQMKIGLSAGPVLFLSVGNPQIGLEYVLAGRPLDRMAEAEHHATATEVLLDGECQQLGIVVGEEREGFLVVKGLTQSVMKVAEKETNLLPTLLVLEQLVPYLPPTVYAQIVEGQRQFVGGHRRVVSLFVNFVGLEYESDPQAGQKLQHYFTAMQEIIHRHGGRLNRVITGDKGSLLHLIFGAPITHEDNEKRAVACALAMQGQTDFGFGFFPHSGIKDLGLEEQSKIQNPKSKTHSLSFITDQRIGLASGYVFAGNVGSEQRREYTVMGDVVNLSARLMQAAKAGEIFLDQSTAQRVAGEFICEALPSIMVKGKQEPIAISRALGEQREGIWQGKEGRVKRHLLPLVGREEELSQLSKIIKLVMDGHGQLLSITGEAGVGKSRLLEEIIALARQHEMIGLGGNCLAYGTQSPYLPWLELFTSFFGLDDLATPQQKIEHLQQQITAIGPALKQWQPLIGQWLGLPIPDNELTTSLDAQLRKQRLFDLILTLLRHRARQGKLLLIVFEDVHWIDAISLEMLNYVARNIAQSPILLVALYRPTIELTEWHKYDHYHHLELTDLSTEDALKLVQFKLGVTEVPAPLRERILQGESRVNPFFVEEMINSLIDRGYLVSQGKESGYKLVGDLSQVEIPDSVQSLVMSRIDRLDESSQLTVKVASVIGRIFKQQILQEIYPLEITFRKLHDDLEKLSTLDLTPLDRPAPEWEYIFKHIVTQEVAYQSLLYAHRRALHYQVGEYLEQTHQDNLTEFYELLAYHYTQSGHQEKAWAYLIKAGDKAKEKYANESAIAYYTQALAIQGDFGLSPFGLVPDRVDKGILDFGLEEQSKIQNIKSKMEVIQNPKSKIEESLGDVYQLIGQYQQAVEHYQQALEGSYLVVQIRRKIAKTWELQGRYDEAMAYLNQTQAILGDNQATLEMAHLYNDMGWIATQRGNFSEALSFCFKGLEIVEDLPDDEKSHRVKDELQHTLGTVYLRTCDYIQAIVHFQECIKMREAIGNLNGLRRSCNNLAVVYWSQGNYNLATQYFQNSLEISQKIGDVNGTALSYNNLGVLCYTVGNYSSAIEHYKKSLEIRKEIGDVPGIADIYNNLGEVSHSLGNYQEARQYLEQAVKIYTEISSKEALIGAYKLLAEVQLELGNLAQATEYCQLSLLASQEIGDQTYEGIAYRVFGQIHRASGSLDKAKLSLQMSLDILMATENKLEIGRSYYQLGVTLTVMGLAEGHEKLQQAIQIFEALGVAGELAKAQAAVSC